LFSIEILSIFTDYSDVLKPIEAVEVIISDSIGSFLMIDGSANSIAIELSERKIL
jgi:hypothetical protein